MNYECIEQTLAAPQKPLSCSYHPLTPLIIKGDDFPQATKEKLNKLDLLKFKPFVHQRTLLRE